jgi:hypothetical protein
LERGIDVAFLYPSAFTTTGLLAEGLISRVVIPNV